MLVRPTNWRNNHLMVITSVFYAILTYTDKIYYGWIRYMREELTIYNENHKEIGVADRDEVHKNGYWHETFQCWFVDNHDGIDYLYLQKRSNDKKDFPNLFDITAAGHLLSTETVADGIREIKEELGIDVDWNHLLSLGVIEDPIETNSFLDREWANVFLYRVQETDQFSLQQEEVAGIVKARFHDFYNLCFDQKKEIRVDGWEINELGARTVVNRKISLKDIVPHRKAYFHQVMKRIADTINN